MMVNIGLIFLISIEFLQVLGQKEPSESLSNIFGDLLKSAGSGAGLDGDSRVTRAPSLLHDLVKNVEKQKEEKELDFKYSEEKNREKDKDFKSKDRTKPEGDEKKGELPEEANDSGRKSQKGDAEVPYNEKREKVDNEGFKPPFEEERTENKNNKNSQLDFPEKGENGFKPPRKEEGGDKYKDEEEDDKERNEYPKKDYSERSKQFPEKEKDLEGFKFPKDKEESNKDRDEFPEKEKDFDGFKPPKDDIDFNTDSELKPVRPPPPIEDIEDYGDEEYSNEVEQNNDESPNSSSEDFGPGVAAVSPSPRKKTPQKRKLKPKQKQWCPDYSNCEDVAGKENWRSFSDSSPSTLCTEAAGRTCIYQRLRPEGRVSLKCGVCRTAFIPRTVDGVDIKSKDKNDAKKFPQTKKLKEAATVSRSKLEWTQVDPSVESCSDGISSSEETNSGSPSVLCEAGVASQDLKCLCARKEDAVKLVCGECRLSLKL